MKNFLEMFQLQPNFKLWWRRARDFDESEIRVITGGFALSTYSIRRSYLTNYGLVGYVIKSFERGSKFEPC